MKDVKLNVAGDFCITPKYFENTVISDGIDILLKEADFNVINLECPILSSNSSKKIIKTGPHLYTDKRIFEYFDKHNINVITLANNHILDYGQYELMNTINTAMHNNIITVGAGENIFEAAKPSILEKNGIKIALINLCENEWSVATISSAGASPLDLIENIKQIRKVRELVDFVVLIIHGGHEYYHLPSPRMVKTYRFFAENGADLIIGHHPHCISGYEIHNNTPIFYSLGNLIFTYGSEYESWYYGLILQITFEKKKHIKWKLIPTKQSKENFSVSILDGNAEKKILNEIEEYHNTIINDTKLYSSWLQFIKNREKYYVNLVSPMNLIPSYHLRKLLFRFIFKNKHFIKSYFITLLNLIRCEAHYDLLKESIKNKIKNYVN